MAIFFFIVGLVLIGWQGYRSYAAWRKRTLAGAYQAWKSAQQYSIIKILVPKNNEKTPQAAEHMFAALHGVFRETVDFQEEISFEYAAYEKFIHFYVHVPTHLRDFVEGQIYAQYPNIEISEAEDYTKLRPAEQTALLAELVLTKEDVYPIKTFMNFTVDPLSGITAVLGNVSAGEQLWVQLIVKPVPENWQEKGIKYVSAKRTGTLHSEGWLRSIIRSMTSVFVLFLRTVLQPATNAPTEAAPAEATTGARETVKLSAPEEAALKGVEEKITKLGFQTKIRFVSIARDAYSARSRIESLTGAFKQFNTTNLNGFRVEGITEDPAAFDRYISRYFDDNGLVLNTEELASLYHLPAATVETPNIAWAGSKKGEPPANLPLEGVEGQEDITFFGTTDFRNFKEKFGIKKLDRRLHMYTIGKTGTGKSTLLMNMIIDDIQKGRGVGVVDPHGQLVTDILERIPAHRINDVIYLNPADRDFPLGFNILESVDPDLRSVVSSGVVGVFKKLFAESWGPRLEYILRNAILALLYYPDTTLLGVNRLLVDDDYRRRVVRKVTDPVVRDFFLEEYDKYDPKFRREAIASIQNKVGQFLSSTTIRNIIGQPKSSFDMRKAMDEGKILLMDLSIGKIGEDNTQMLGSMLITKVQLSAMSRADVAEDQRRDFYLYVDEFQNFATEAFAVMLSEARKYHLNLTLTNQYISQMPEEVAHAIFGNVGTIISFRVGAGDASGLVKEFEPVFEAIDMVNLDNRHIYVKMAIDGVTRPAFSAATLPPLPSIGTDHIDKIVKVSRERYSKPRSMVEQKIQEWADDVQVQQAQEWRKRITAAEQVQHQQPAARGAGQVQAPKSVASQVATPTMSTSTAKGGALHQSVVQGGGEAGHKSPGNHKRNKPVDQTSHTQSKQGEQAKHQPQSQKSARLESGQQKETGRDPAPVSGTGYAQAPTTGAEQGSHQAKSGHHSQPPKQSGQRPEPMTGSGPANGTGRGRPEKHQPHERHKPIVPAPHVKPVNLPKVGEAPLIDHADIAVLTKQLSKHPDDFESMDEL